MVARPLPRHAPVQRRPSLSYTEALAGLLVGVGLFVAPGVEANKNLLSALLGDSLPDVPDSPICQARLEIVRRNVLVFLGGHMHRPADKDERKQLTEKMQDESGALLLHWCCTMPGETVCWGAEGGGPTLMLVTHGGTQDWAHCCFYSLRKPFLQQPAWIAEEVKDELGRLDQEPDAGCDLWHPAAFEAMDAEWGHRFCRIQVVGETILPCDIERLHAYKGPTKVVRAEQIYRALVLIQAHVGVPDGLDIIFATDDSEVSDWPVPVLAPARTNITNRILLIPPLELLSPFQEQVVTRVMRASSSKPWSKKHRKVFFRGVLSNSWPYHGPDGEQARHPGELKATLDAAQFAQAFQNTTAPVECQCSTWQECNKCVDRMVPKTASNWASFTRGRLVQLARSAPHAIDARLSPCKRDDLGRCEDGCVKELFEGDICTELERANVTAPPGTPPMGTEDHVQHRYLIVPDGSGYANRIYWMAFSNSLLIVPQSSLLSWLKPGSRLFRPYEHFLPVREDLSNLLDVWKWAEAHPAECEAMALAAQRTARSAFTMEPVLQYWHQLVEGYADRQRRAQRRCQATWAAA